MSDPKSSAVSQPKIDQADDSELSPEELNQISGGTGSGKRSAYNANQQPWQATI